jgi:hypothetical protein
MSFREKLFGEKLFGEKSFGEKLFGERSFGEKSFGEKLFGELPWYRSFTTHSFQFVMVGQSDFSTSWFWAVRKMFRRRSGRTRSKISGRSTPPRCRSTWPEQSMLRSLFLGDCLKKEVLSFWFTLHICFVILAFFKSHPNLPFLKYSYNLQTIWLF